SRLTRHLRLLRSERSTPPALVVKTIPLSELQNHLLTSGMIYSLRLTRRDRSQKRARAIMPHLVALLVSIALLFLPTVADPQQAASTVGTCPTTAISVSPGLGTLCYRIDTRDLFVWTGVSWKRVLTESSRGQGYPPRRTLPIYASDFVTAGDGTPQNPWTGWDRAVVTATPKVGGTVAFDAGY